MNNDERQRWRQIVREFERCVEALAHKTADVPALLDSIERELERALGRQINRIL